MFRTLTPRETSVFTNNVKMSSVFVFDEAKAWERRQRYWINMEGFHQSSADSPQHVCNMSTVAVFGTDDSHVSDYIDKMHSTSQQLL